MVKDDHIHLSYLRKNDLCPIGYKKVCRNTGEEVSQDEIVKGYEYQKGDYVVLDEADFEKASPEKTYSIVIEDFVNDKEVDMKYAEKPYFVMPDKKSHTVYVLFREALKASGKAGIGKFVMRSNEYLVILRAQGDALMLNTLRYQRAFRDANELDFPKASKIPKNQMDLALELINKLSSSFDPGKYTDTYSETIEKIIEAKTHGKTPAPKAYKPHVTAGADIVNRLKESLAKAGR
jgi:DNA end-binding protein Ku